MANKQETVEMLLHHAASGLVHARKMFGEYGIYYADRMVAILANDELYIKQSEAAKRYLPHHELAYPFPGAKQWIVVPIARWSRAGWLARLFSSIYHAIKQSV